MPTRYPECFLLPVFFSIMPFPCLFLASIDHFFIFFYLFSSQISPLDAKKQNFLYFYLKTQILAPAPAPAKASAPAIFAIYFRKISNNFHGFIKFSCFQSSKGYFK
jgi:hypothetical protein